MKRGKKYSTLTFVFGLVLILLMCTTLYITFSYFSASARRRGSVGMGSLTLELTDSTGAELSTNAIITQVTDPIVPGEEITLNNIYVKNTSNFAVYSIIKLRAEITKSGETEPSATYEKWMNLSGNEVVSGTTSADEIASNTQKQGSISLQIPSSLDNTYQGATARLTYKALAVQKAHIPPLENGTEAQYACKFLYEEYAPRDISIKVGNSTAKTMTLDGNIVADVTVSGVTTDNSCGWYYDEACTRPAYSTDVLTSNTQLYTKQATTEKLSGTSSVSASSTSISGEVVIPQTVNGTKVTTIASNAFKDCTEITSVVIPEGVTKINSSAFSGCSSLETITIPSTCTSIGGLAFENNTNLRSVVLHNDLISISADGWAVPAFSNCSKAVFNQYDNAYYLGNENNPYIACVQVVKTSLTTCEMAPTCKFIAQWAFHYAAIRSLVLPEGMIRLYSNALYGCTNLTSISLPNSMQRIDGSALSDTGLQSLHIPENVTYFGTQFMYDGKNIKYLSVDPNNTVYDSRNNCNCIIRTADNYLVMGCMNSVIPEGVETIGTQSFCKVAIKKIVLPNSVTKIESRLIYQTGNTTTYIWVPNSVAIVESTLVPYGSKLIMYCECNSQPSSWKNQNGQVEIYFGKTYDEFLTDTENI